MTATGPAHKTDNTTAAFGPYNTPGAVSPCTSGNTDSANIAAPRIPTSALSVRYARTSTGIAAAAHNDAATVTNQNNVTGDTQV